MISKCYKFLMKETHIFFLKTRDLPVYVPPFSFSPSRGLAIDEDNVCDVLSIPTQKMLQSLKGYYF